MEITVIRGVMIWLFADALAMLWLWRCAVKSGETMDGVMSYPWSDNPMTTPDLSGFSPPPWEQRETEILTLVRELLGPEPECACKPKACPRAMRQEPCPAPWLHHHRQCPVWITRVPSEQRR